MRRTPRRPPSAPGFGSRQETPTSPPETPRVLVQRRRLCHYGSRQLRLPQSYNGVRCPRTLPSLMPLSRAISIGLQRWKRELRTSRKSLEGVQCGVVTSHANAKAGVGNSVPLQGSELVMQCGRGGQRSGRSGRPGSYCTFGRVTRFFPITRTSLWVDVPAVWELPRYLAR